MQMACQDKLLKTMCGRWLYPSLNEGGLKKSQMWGFDFLMNAKFIILPTLKI